MVSQSDSGARMQLTKAAYSVANVRIRCSYSSALKEGAKRESCKTLETLIIVEAAKQLNWSWVCGLHSARETLF